MLINSSCEAKVADFGLARSLACDDEKVQAAMTECVATRWYRAPELLLGSQHYHKPVDMWSIGCIFGEMLNGKTVFPGHSTLDQMEKILEVTGKPTSKISELGDAIMSNILNSPASRTKSFGSFFPTASEGALDFLKDLLKFNPA